ncbi:MAG: UTP--glucose-1-phosphate uridylyltransferase [Rhabdochlamydiaceae bacterium]
MNDFIDITKKKDGQIIYDTGLKILKQNGAALLIMAGGVGSRLGHKGPKGTFTFPNTGKSLFEYLFSYVKKKNQDSHSSLPIIIMTSQENDQETRDFLESSHFFGLDKNSLFFIIQKSLPYLNDENNEFIDNQQKPLLGPSGNGQALNLLCESGLLSILRVRGVQFIISCPIDNPLADPLNPYFLGYQKIHEKEIVAQCIEKGDPLENVGVFVRKKGKLKVIEYTELSQEEKIALDVHGQLVYRFANISIFSFSMDFVEKSFPFSLPLHMNKKEVFLNDKKILAWKQEYHIFDLLEHADHTDLFLVSREEVFCPLKTKEDIDKIEKKLAYHKN